MSTKVFPVMNRTPSNLSDNPQNVKLSDQRLIHDATLPYADDQELYKPRLDRVSKLTYWQRLIVQARSIRVRPAGFQTWVMIETASEGDIQNYPKLYVRIARVMVSNLWDHWYLNMALIWLALMVLQDRNIDGESLPVSIFSNILLVPLALMILIQLTPLIGTCILMIYCNDLMQELAARNLGDWAFISMIIAQYIERFYFRGVNRQYTAGKCKRNIAPVKYITSRKSKLLVGAETMDDLDMLSSINDLTSVNMESGITPSVIQRQVSFESSVAGSIASDKSSPRAIKSPTMRARVSERYLESTVMMEWTCVTCTTHNREPRHPYQDPLILQKSVGDLYTRTFAVIKPRRDIPQCRKCFTDADYVPSKAVAHLFVHYPERYSAFSNYPLKVDVSPGLSRSWTMRLLRYISSCCCGLRDDIDSLLLNSDWRMHKYLPSKFVDIQRPVKLEDDLFARGEVIESKHQKVGWTRARIVQARINHSYDIVYDTGETLRYVSEKVIRLPPMKRVFAYRVELCMLFLVITFPICAMAAIHFNPRFLFGSILLVGAYLLVLRIYMFMKYAYKYHATGLCAISTISLLLTAPIFMLFLTGALSYAVGDMVSWLQVFYSFCITLITSLPLLTMMRSEFLFVALVLFVQVLVGGVMIAIYADNRSTSPILYSLIPFISSIVTIKVIRRYMSTLIDPCLVIRPAANMMSKPIKTLKWRWQKAQDLFNLIRK